ncbi:MAG: hypothetical protein ACTSO9_03470 [Candidatus Helarchaeota archaeon]
MKEGIFKEKNYVIRKMALPHCARGPKWCEKCAEAAKNKRTYLLEVYFDPGTMARPMIEISVQGEKMLNVYDVIKEFKTEEKAREYAKENGLYLIEEK